jgi:hypothetical protein
MHQKHPPPKVMRSLAAGLLAADSVFTGSAEKDSGAMTARAMAMRTKKRIFTIK